MPITFSMLLTLVSSSNAENAETLWGFIGRYRPGVTPQTHPKLDAMVGDAIRSLRESRSSSKKIPPARRERAGGVDRPARCAAPAVRLLLAPEKIQEVVYEIGRREPFLDHKKLAKDGRPGVALNYWFNMLYQVLLGKKKGRVSVLFVAG